jgi:competence ComEA-like helix-hairpin-helix protein
MGIYTHLLQLSHRLQLKELNIPVTVGYDSYLQDRGTLFLIKRSKLVKEKKMFKKTALFIFALLFLVSSAFAAININKADQAALESLPGIGAKKAAAIIDHRTQNGDFKTKEELLQIKGIGPKMLEKMQQEIEI